MLRGIVGAVKWHHYTAAAINNYEVTPTPDARGRASTLVATVVLQDAFKLSQRPLMFVAPHKQGAWTWPIVEFTIADNGRMVAKLGPPVDQSGW